MSARDELDEAMCELMVASSKVVEAIKKVDELDLEKARRLVALTTERNHLMERVKLLEHELDVARGLSTGTPSEDDDD